MRGRQARAGGTAEQDDFGLLLQYGADCIGAVGIRPDGIASEPTRKLQLRLALEERHRAQTDQVDLQVGDIEDRLASVVEGTLRPLYERFDGFMPPADLFTGQIADLMRHRVAADDR